MKIVDSMSAIASHNNIRVSPQKLNLVAGLIRGMKCSDAINELQFSNKRISVEVLKVLRSAIANAENNHNLNVEKLYVESVLVGKGLVMKRFMARARGSGNRILKPFSNLKIIVKQSENQ